MQPSSNVVPVFALLMFLVVSSSLASAASLGAFDSPAVASMVDSDARKLEQDVVSLVAAFEEEGKKPGIRKINFALTTEGTKAQQNVKTVKNTAMNEFYGQDTKEVVTQECLNTIGNLYKDLNPLNQSKPTQGQAQCYFARIFHTGRMPQGIVPQRIGLALADKKYDEHYGRKTEKKLDEFRRVVLRLLGNSGPKLFGLTAKARRYFTFGIAAASVSFDPSIPRQCEQMTHALDYLKSYDAMVEKTKENNYPKDCDDKLNKALKTISGLTTSIATSSNSRQVTSTATALDPNSDLLNHRVYVEDCLIHGHVLDGNTVAQTNVNNEKIDEFNKKIWLRHFARKSLFDTYLATQNRIQDHIIFEVHRYLSFQTNSQIIESLKLSEEAFGNYFQLSLELLPEKTTKKHYAYKILLDKALRSVKKEDDELLKSVINKVRAKVDKFINDPTHVPLPEDFILGTRNSGIVQLDFPKQTQFPTIDNNGLVQTTTDWIPTAGNGYYYAPFNEGRYGWLGKECGPHAFLWKFMALLAEEVKSIQEELESLRRQHAQDVAEQRAENLAEQAQSVDLTIEDFL